MQASPPTRRVVFACEACGSRLVKRTSYLTHKFLRHDTYVCDNPVCAAAYSGHTELTGIASPTGMPNAAPCGLPPTPAYERAKAQEVYRQQMQDAQMDLALDGATDTEQVQA